MLGEKKGLGAMTPGERTPFGSIPPHIIIMGDIIPPPVSYSAIQTTPGGVNIMSAVSGTQRFYDRCTPQSADTDGGRSTCIHWLPIRAP